MLTNFAFDDEVYTAFANPPQREIPKQLANEFRQLTPFKDQTAFVVGGKITKQGLMVVLGTRRNQPVCAILAGSIFTMDEAHLLAKEVFGA